MTATRRPKVVAWQAPPAHVTLEACRVDVWRFTLDASDQQVALDLRRLSADERARAARFYFERDRLWFIVGRATLRVILADYLHSEPAALRLAAGAHGKPFLTRRTGARSGPLQSDALRCTGVVCCRRGYAGWYRPGGHARSRRHGVHHAHRVYTNRTRGRGITAGGRPTAGLLTGWTRKEAVVKARGDGLAYDVRHFSVTLAPGQPAGVVDFDDAPREAAYWWLVDIPVGSSCSAALAVRRPAPSEDWGVRLWQCARAAL